LSGCNRVARRRHRLRLAPLHLVMLSIASGNSWNVAANRLQCASPE
jgi:hypothetical protein